MLLPLLIAFQSLAEGENCPAALDVEARVRTILHLAPERQLSESFLVERREAGLYVVLRGADSAVIGERTLPAQGSCDELAQAAAVVLSTWLTDVHPDFAGELPPRPIDPEPPVLAPAPPPVPVPEPIAQPAAKPPAPPPVAAPTRGQERFDASLGIGTQFSGGELGPLAGLLGVRYGAPVQGFGVTAFGVLTTTRSDPLGEGEVEWRRWPFGLGAEVRFSSPRVSLDISAGPILGWLRLEGHAFDVTSAQSGIDWGGFLNMRASARSRPLAPFIWGSMQIYPSQSSAYVANQEGELSLPTVSFALCVGLLLAR